MWLFTIALLFILAGIAGVIVGGGPAIVLIPIGLILGVWAGMLRRRHAQDAGASTELTQEEETEQPLPSSFPSDGGHVPTSPEGLTDARRLQQ